MNQGTELTSNLELGGIYLFNQHGFQNMQPHAKQVLDNISHQVSEKFKGYPITKKGQDIIRSALKAKEAKIISDYQGTIANDPGVHSLVVNNQGGILENFEEKICMSEILGDKGQTDEDIANICFALQSMGINIIRESA